MLLVAANDQATATRAVKVAIRYLLHMPLPDMEHLPSFAVMASPAEIERRTAVTTWLRKSSCADDDGRGRTIARHRPIERRTARRRRLRRPASRRAGAGRGSGLVADQNVGSRCPVIQSQPWPGMPRRWWSPCKQPRVLRGAAPGPYATCGYRVHRLDVSAGYRPARCRRRRFELMVARMMTLRNLDRQGGSRSRRTSCDGGGERSVQVARERVVELPGDRHRPFAHMAPIRRGAEEPEGAIVGAQSGEEQDGAVLALVVAVAKAGWAVGPRGRLALPVDERRG